MSDEQERNFLGIPISGDIYYRRDRSAQRTQEEFAQIVQAVLDDESIIDFGWRQYTPYFNDGDECVFSAHGLWVRTKNAPTLTPEGPSWEQRFLQAVANKLPYAYVLTATGVLRMIAEALKEVPAPDVATVIEERDQRILTAFATQLAVGDTVASYHARAALELVLKTLDEPEPQDEEELDDDFDDDLYSFKGGSKHGLGEIAHDGYGDLGNGIRGRLNERYEGPDEARYQRVEALDRAIDDGEFNDVLLKLFGDHASVRVTRSGIEVEEYSHD